jgi:RimJ/RimL family protein N-acetyltransferase
MAITQRTATLNDADILLTWRNHPSTRKYSRQPEQISSDVHIEWLTTRLKKVQSEPFYLFLENSKVIGMSRLDAVSGSVHQFEISILVNPELHGKGMGTKILSWTCDSFFDLQPHHTIVAYVHRYNHISQKLFIGAGFELLTSPGEFLHYEKSLN